MSDAKNKLTELKSRIEEAKEAVKAEYGQKLKELSEFMHGLEKHEVHAIVSVSHHHPYYASLGLQYVPVGDLVDKPARKERGKGKGTPKAAVKGNKPKRKMSAAGRARIVAAQKARWAKVKAAKKK